MLLLDLISLRKGRNNLQSVQIDANLIHLVISSMVVYIPDLQYCF